MTPVLRPILNAVYLYTMASETEIELIEPKEFYIKRLEQPYKGGWSIKDFNRVALVIIRFLY